MICIPAGTSTAWSSFGCKEGLSIPAFQIAKSNGHSQKWRTEMIVVQHLKELFCRGEYAVVFEPLLVRVLHNL